MTDQLDHIAKAIGLLAMAGGRDRRGPSVTDYDLPRARARLDPVQTSHVNIRRARRVLRWMAEHPGQEPPAHISQAARFWNQLPPEWQERLRAERAENKAAHRPRKRLRP